MNEAPERGARDERQHAQHRLRQAQLLAEVADLGAHRAKTTLELRAAVITAAREGVPIRHLSRASLFSHVTVGKWVKHGAQHHTEDFRPQGSGMKKEHIMKEEKAGLPPVNGNQPRPEDDLRSHLENLKFTLAQIVKGRGVSNPTAAGLLSGQYDGHLTQVWERDLRDGFALVVRAFKTLSSVPSTSADEKDVVYIDDDQPSKIVTLLEPHGWCDRHVRPVDTVLVGVETDERFGGPPGGRPSCARCLYNRLHSATDSEFGRTVLLRLNEILIETGETDALALCQDEKRIRSATHAHRIQPSAADAEAYEREGPMRSGDPYLGGDDDF